MKPNFEVLESHLSEEDMALFVLIMPLYQAVAAMAGEEGKAALINALNAHIDNYAKLQRPKAQNMILSMREAVLRINSSY